MRKIRFGDFLERNYPFCPDEALYILNNSNNVLYIGISKQDIWDRWFDRDRSHLPSNPLLRTQAGDEVMRNLPASMDWIIEFWSLQDCYAFLKDELKIHGRKKFWSINVCEVEMIRKLHPVLNVEHNPNRVITAEDEKRMHLIAEEIGKLYDDIAE